MARPISLFSHAITIIISLSSSTLPMMAEEPIFENVTAASGLGGGSFVAWADYDNDGDTDVVTGGKLYQNNGKGQFTQVETFNGGGHGVWGDFDNDRFPDLYVSNLEGQANKLYDGQPNRLYRNNGDGTFTEHQTDPVAFEFPLLIVQQTEKFPTLLHASEKL